MEQSENAPAATGLRERKKMETRRTIRRVALDLALDLGVENLTVEAIAHAADVSPRTFFNYFAHKQDALVTDAAAAAVALRPDIVARPADESPLQAIKAVITENDSYSLMNADRDRALDRQKLVQQHPALVARQLGQYTLLERTFAEAIAERLGIDPDEDLRPVLIASVAGAAMRVAVQRWTAGDAASLRDLLRTAFDMLEQGLLSDAPGAASPPADE